MILTIAIPVYNGAEYISETIKSIFEHYHFDKTKIEIIVCDNASNDGTAELVANYPNVKLYTHTQNIGYDGNLERIFEYANGNYVWAVGADDLIARDIAPLVDILTNCDKGVVFVGGKDSLTEPYLEIDTAENFLLQSNFRSGFFPNNIIQKQVWLDCDRASFIGSGWLHYAVVLQAVRRERTMLTKETYVIENPNANGVKGWNNNGQGLLIGLKLVDVFQIMPEWGYSKDFVKRTKMVIKGAYPRGIIVAKMRGLRISRPILNSFIRVYKEFFTFWLIDFLLLITPSILYRIIYKPFNIFKKLI